MIFEKEYKKLEAMDHELWSLNNAELAELSEEEMQKLDDILRYIRRNTNSLLDSLNKIKKEGEK